MVFKQKASLLLRWQLCCHTATQSCVKLTDPLPLDVDPSILIPGNDLLAVWTNPLLLAELQLTEVAATMAAGLAGGIPLINEDEMFSLLCQLIPEASMASYWTITATISSWSRRMETICLRTLTGR